MKFIKSILALAALLVVSLASAPAQVAAVPLNLQPAPTVLTSAQVAPFVTLAVADVKASSLGVTLSGIVGFSVAQGQSNPQGPAQPTTLTVYASLSRVAVPISAAQFNAFATLISVPQGVTLHSISVQVKPDGTGMVNAR